MNNAQKTPFVSTQNAFAARKAQEALNLLGKSLPCSIAAIPTPGVPIVTVKFEIQDPTFSTLPNVTVPVLGSEYIRLPLQAGAGSVSGTRGVVIAIDAYIGGISGLGGGVADLSQRGNLATLVFVPISNRGWQAASDPNALTLYGVDATTINSTLQHESSVTVTKTGVTANAVNGGSTLTMTSNAIQLTAAGHTLVINSAGIALDGKLFAPHTHIGVSSGTGITGPVS